ncbi:MAG: UDP-glucose 4-epimerase GalE [Clostridiaceae bacterium]|nr:UDP-glucose 4-epimerase GalE [Eubacteriales bacterium]
MAVLLTGGTGYIGAHTAVALLEAGREAVLADDLSNSKAEVLERIEKITGKRPAFYQIDISDGAALSKVFEAHKIDTVIHFAGFKAVGESVKKPLDYYKNNLNATIEVLRAMLKYGAKNLVFSSSATVYGPYGESPLKEDAPTGCINPYGWTKWMSEQIIRDAAKAHPELSCVLLRYFNPVGAHPSGLIGEDPNGIPNNLMPYISQVAVGKLDHLTVYGDDYNTPDGTGVRDYIHVSDLAQGHLAAVSYCERHAGVEAVNLGTGRGISVLELLRAFERVNGVKVPFEIGPRRAGDVDECFADTQKAASLFNWRATRTAEDMCRDAWNWQSKNPRGYEITSKA